MLSALGTRSSGQATRRFGTSRPATNVGAVISQAIAGSFAYQPRSAVPSRSASQPPAKTPAQPPMKMIEARKLAVEMRSSPKLRISTDGVHSARPYPLSELQEAAKAMSQKTGFLARKGKAWE